MKRRTSTRLGLVLSLWLATACSTGPERLNVGGTWQGSAMIPTATATTLTLIQGGSTISGTIDITGVLSHSFVGTLDEGRGILAWTLLDGCTQWTGSFSVNASGSQMSGPVLGDASACSGGTDTNGTISLSKQ